MDSWLWKKQIGWCEYWANTALMHSIYTSLIKEVFSGAVCLGHAEQADQWHLCPSMPQYNGKLGQKMGSGKTDDVWAGMGRGKTAGECEEEEEEGLEGEGKG